MSEHDPNARPPAGPPPGAQPPPPGSAPPPPPGQQPPAGQQPYGQQPYGQQPPPRQQYGQQPPPYAQQAPAAGSQVGQPADLMTRFLARLIDQVVLGIAAMIVFAIVGAVFAAIAISGASTGGLFGGFWISAISAVVITAIWLLYFAFLESSRGQTLGKMAMKIRTFGPGGGNPTMNVAIKRNIWLAAPVLGIIPIVGTFIGGLIMLVAMIYIAVTINNNTATRQGWHDMFAGGTSVIKIG